jgi:dsDNA-binding SOS-regulon protein
MDFKKEFKELNKDPKYLKELIELGHDEELFLSKQNADLKELLLEMCGKLNECLEYHTENYNHTEIYSDILHIHDFCEEHLRRITNA